MDLEKLSPEELLDLAKNQAAKIEAQETTIEELNTKVDEQSTRIEQLNTVIGNAKQQTVIDISKKDQAPVIPTEPVEHEGKKHKWKRASFRLPGDTKKYTAQEASVDPEVIGKILKLEGQSILEEQQ